MSDRNLVRCFDKSRIDLKTGNPLLSIIRKTSHEEEKDPEQVAMEFDEALSRLIEDEETGS